MAITYGGYRCQDPQLLHRSFVDRDWPTPWLGKVNHFIVPLGKGPGTGAILLRWEDLNALLPVPSGSAQRPTPAYDLTFADERGNSVTLQKITIRSYDCVTPGARDDDNAVYKVELVDKRFLIKGGTNRAFNVSSCDGTTFLSGTMSGGSASWSWQGVLDQLWTDAGLGTAPTLPFTPDGSPENIAYYGWYAWDAICDFLDRIACRVKLNPEDDTYSIVRLGYGPNTANAAIDANEANRQREWDAYAGEPEYAWRPEKVRVLFPVRPEPPDGTSPLYPVDITLATARGVPSGSLVILHDDLTALGNPPSNLSNLTTRANERATDWLTKRTYFDAPFQVIYYDVQENAVPDILSSIVERVAFKDVGYGLKTEALAKPDYSLERWKPLGEPPINCSGSGGSDSTQGGRLCVTAGWLSDKEALVIGDGVRPKFMQVEIFDGATGGRCDCILSQGQDVQDIKYPWLAIYNSTAGAWQLMPIMRTCCGCADMTIDITGPNAIDTVDETMTAVLTVSSSCNGGAPYTYDLIFQCATALCVLFTGAGKDNCNGSAPYPCDNSFQVRICCTDCDIATTNCDQCIETCAPLIYWIPNPGFTGTCTAYNRDWYLYQVSDCVWQADFCGIVATLTMTRGGSSGNDSIMDVQFTGGCATIEYKYTETGQNLGCFADHTLTKVTVNAESPATIDVNVVACGSCPDCCNSVFGTPPTYNGITATLSNKTGGCECLILTEISHTYTPNWKVTYGLTGCTNDTQLVVNCILGRISLTVGLGTGYSLTVVSFTCDPFLYVADITFTSDPTNPCPSGSFRITLTR